MAERSPSRPIVIVVELESSPSITSCLGFNSELDRSEVAITEAVLEAPRYPEPGKGSVVAAASSAVIRAD